jgi:hypothetical protein
MIIVGKFVPPFGIAGAAAAIIKFRTPVDDTTEATILFLLMRLRTSAGLGAFAMAGLGTAFLCTALLALDHTALHKVRIMLVAIMAAGYEFPGRGGSSAAFRGAD